MPRRVRTLIRSTVKKIVYFARFVKIIILSRLGVSIKIVLGAALTHQEGWCSTNEQYLDIRNINNWKRLFGNKVRIEAMLAEHVFEHLSYTEMTTVLDICNDYLEKNGTLLIAVPDGNHPDAKYRAHCGVNGIGADAGDHKQFITFEMLNAAAKNSSFNCRLLEEYDENGKLHAEYKASIKIGKIIRTRENLNNNDKQGWDFPDSNTSMIALLRK